MNYFVTDKIGHLMSLDISEKLRNIEPKTYEESFPFEDNILFCYKKGTEQECQDFIDSKITKIQDCLEVQKIE